jgi:hypothetical protein
MIYTDTHAQNKTTNVGITGKWRLKSINMEGLMYYDIDKDSLEFISQSFRTAVLSTAGENSLDSIKSSFKSGYFIFETNGIFITGDSTKTDDISGYYYVDEKTNELSLKPINGKILPDELVTAKKYLKDNLLVVEMSLNGKRLITEFIKCE